MTITYKAEVITIPDNIEKILGIEVDNDVIAKSQFYNTLWKILAHTKAIEAGSINYGATYEWATFHTLSDAKNFEKQLKKFAKELLKEIPKIMAMKESETL